MAANRILSSIVLAMLAVLIVGCSDEEKTPTCMTDAVGFNHLEGYVAAPPLSDGKFLYAATGSGSVHKVNIETGRIAWTFKEVGGFINNTPVLAKDALLIIGSQGNLVSIDRETGEKRWIKPEKTGEEWKMGDEKLGVPSVVGCFGYDPASGVAVVGDKEGRVFLVDGETGTVKKYTDLKARLYAAPLFRNGAVFLATMGGRLHAFNIDDLSNRWELPKILLSSVEGKKHEKGGEESDGRGSPYSLTVEYKYNFDDSDHFEPGEDGSGNRIEIFLLDGDGQPVKIVEGDDDASSKIVEGIEPGDHLGSGSHTQSVTLRLVSPPGSEQGWPVTVAVKDDAGQEIDRLDGAVDFAAAKAVAAE